ncbi:signal recognition particle-docking protein FtsY [Reinekea marinisedimentorum]|uniref:Signal recognition particle receptor FtsY n=1 Tax=Reinekea marinisedimentorum TaxID=230495 RepID=A0A4V2UIS3_9GAMM|nr:signal recognition particle-docking protein FtsY [Reinekea marinisedimentorum]TCS37190.1 fused signal recognition particle receptor [Reinekea marinisedimentorum]
MFGFSKRKDKTPAQEKPEAQAQTPAEQPPAPAPEQPVAEAPAEPSKKRWVDRVKSGLGKTREQFSSGVATAVLGKKTLDEDILDALEMLLLTSDVGIESTKTILDSVIERLSRKELGTDGNAIMMALRDVMVEILTPVEAPLVIDTSKSPYVILVVGVNGVGKTTTIGKMTKRFQSEGHSVMLAAGDTFRAAAVEQLQTWGERNNVPVIAQHTGADSASVIFDAVQAAKARNVDVVIADTAGRLHNKDNLMTELEKVQRVIKKFDQDAPHEVLLVLDAGTGQNAVNQAEAFTKATPLTGLALTKLDGTAKGGIIFSLANKLDIPVRYIGVGEQAEDLNRFAAQEFVHAMLGLKAP